MATQRRTASRLPAAETNGPGANPVAVPQLRFDIAPDPRGDVITLRLPHNFMQTFADGQTYRMHNRGPVEWELVLTGTSAAE